MSKAKLMHANGEEVRETPNSKTMAEKQQQAANPVQVPGIPNPEDRKPQGNQDGGARVVREEEAPKQESKLGKIADVLTGKK